MQLPQPYLHTSPRMAALVDRQYMLPVEGPVADSVYGYHTLWAAEVPFIPAHVGKDDGDFDTEATNRLVRVLQRQVRFLYDLAKSQEHLSTFELRFVSWPQPNGLARVGVAFLGKTFHADKRVSCQLALGLWDKFSAIFPREVPFSYPLVPVRHFDKNVSGESHSFMEWFTPIPFEHLNTAQSIIELRKYEDWPTIRDVGGVLHARDYIPHPFKAALDYSALARLLETLARQQQVSMVAITLRPQRLTDQEVVILHELAGWYQRAARGEVTIDNPLVDVLKELKSDIFESYTRARAELGQKVYDDLVREHRSLFLVRLQVVGTPFAQDDLIEALGSEIMANAGSAYPSRWDRVEASPHDLGWARFNLQWLEFARWGVSRLIQQDRRIIRLRSLATVQEAAGAFRLPVAPTTGGIAGLEVRDEPFPLVSTTLPANQSGFRMGILLDRGVPTDIPCMLPFNALAEIVQVFGEAGETRDCVLEHMLGGVQASSIPWVLIRRADSSAMQFTESPTVCRITVDEAMDMSRWNSLGIQPFLPPPGVPLMRFLDALLRVFMTVYGLDATVGALLRQALGETYQNAGWIGQEVGRMVDLKALASHVETIAQQSHVPPEIAGLLRTRCSLPLRDVAATAVNMLNLPYKEVLLLAEPLVIEVGWLGSDLSNTLIRACLWMWYTLALASTSTVEQTLRGIVGLEEAHTFFGTVMSSSGSVSPVASLAHSSTNAKVGTLLIDDRPDLLDADITNRAAITILTRNGNGSTLERTAALIDASQRQRMRIARLNPSEAVVATRGAAPMLITL
jgi:hypothetical protein